MEESKILLQKLKISEIEDVVKIHQQCFPESRSTKLGSIFLSKMYRWFLTFYPDLAIGAASDGQLLGFVTGSIGETSRERFLYTFFEIVWGFLIHPRLFLDVDMFESWQSYIRSLISITIASKSLSSTSSDTGEVVLKAGLSSIAVIPRARGKGIGRYLVEAFEARAREYGATILRLGVELDNEGARRLYERCGWSLETEYFKHNSATYSKLIDWKSKSNYVQSS